MTQKTRMATGALSHLIGAYYLLGALACNCEPRKDPEMKQILLHLKGLYWAFMSKKYGIQNPKRTDLDTREFMPPLRSPELKPMPNIDVGDTSDSYKERKTKWSEE